MTKDTVSHIPCAPHAASAHDACHCGSVFTQTASWRGEAAVFCNTVFASRNLIPVQ